MSQSQRSEDSLETYLSADYPITIVPADNGQFVASIKDLPGCVVQADNCSDALKSIQVACKLWIEAAYDQKKKIPQPSSVHKYSGRVLIRMSPLLHKTLLDSAQREGISLNQYMVTHLALAANPRSLESKNISSEPLEASSGNPLEDRVSELVEEVQQLKRLLEGTLTPIQIAGEVAEIHNSLMSPQYAINNVVQVGSGAAAHAAHVAVPSHAAIATGFAGAAAYIVAPAAHVAGAATHVAAHVVPISQLSPIVEAMEEHQSSSTSTAENTPGGSG